MANKRANSKPIVRSAVYRPKDEDKPSKSSNNKGKSKDNSVSPKDVRKAKRKNTYSF